MSYIADMPNQWQADPPIDKTAKPSVPSAPRGARVWAVKDWVGHNETTVLLFTDFVAARRRARQIIRESEADLCEALDVLLAQIDRWSPDHRNEVLYVDQGDDEEQNLLILEPETLL